MFAHIEPYAGDPILSLNEAFQKDPRTQKVNLSIGIYFDNDGRIPLLDTVRSAELQIVQAGAARPYLPMEGLAVFRRAVQGLLWGQDASESLLQRIATVQTVGSSAGLKLGADFIARFLPGRGVWVSDPTWDNHRAVFEGAGLTVQTYPYYDPATGGLRFDALLAHWQTLPLGSVVLLHACCHNPTGVDLLPEQWDALIPVIQARQLLPFLDLAYQGFAQGVDEDAHVVRRFTQAGLSFLVANSFSKNMSLYGERVGALQVLCPDADQAGRVLGQLKATVRRSYSSPPEHGAAIAARVLSDPLLRTMWFDEVRTMRERIADMRRRLHDGLKARLPEREFQFILDQKGMFSYTGLTPAQVDTLRNDWGVYLVRSGRLCVAGLNTHQVDRVAEAMAAVWRTDSARG